MATHTLVLLVISKVAIRTIVHARPVMEEVVMWTLLAQAVLITLDAVIRAVTAFCVGRIIALLTAGCAGVIQQQKRLLTAQTAGRLLLTGFTFWGARLAYVTLRKPSPTLHHTHSILQIKSTATPLAQFGVLAADTPFQTVVTPARRLVGKCTRWTMR